MTFVGLFAWFCLIFSAFAHLSTFFVGGAVMDWTTLIPTLLVAASFWVWMWRSRRAGAWSRWTQLMIVVLTIYVLGSTWITTRRIQQFRSTLPPEGRYALTYDGKITGSRVEGVQELEGRLDARRWTGFWLWLFFIPAMMTGEQEPGSPRLESVKDVDNHN